MIRVILPSHLRALARTDGEVQPDAPLPEPVADGTEPFMIVGAMAGG
jgi:hypothetical protein